MNTKWAVIGRGFAGWHATGLNTTGSGGDIADYLASAADGALVYDAEDADRGAYVRHVMAGPMLDPSLPPDGVKKFGEDLADTAAHMLPGLSGGFAVLAAAAQSPSYGGLDSVGVGVFERLLRAIPGVKIGHVQGGVVVWA